jgi:LEA14-like dessication related protein
MKKILVILGLSGIAFGLYTFYLKQLEILTYLKYRLVGIKILETTLSNVKVQLNVEIINDSDIDITITDYTLDCYVNDLFVGTIKNQTTNQNLKGLGGVSNFPMSLNIGTNVFLGKGLISGLVENFKNSTIRISGTWGIKKGIITIDDLPMDETYKIREFMA